MHPQVVILSLILHLADSVAGSVKVGGEAGPSVTLPCHYSGAVTSMCWNRGSCSLFTCQNGIVWTNGTHVTYRKDTRYKLLGDLARRDVSLTIENTAVSDSGVYCCRVEHRGWFNDMKITVSLEIVPPKVTTTPIVTTVPTVMTVRTSTTVPTTTTVPMTTTVPTTTVPTTMSIPTTTTVLTTMTVSTTTSVPTTTSIPTTTSVPVTTTVSTFVPPMPLPRQNHEPVATSPSSPQPAETHPMTLQGAIRTEPTSSSLYSYTTDGNDTVTESSDGLWNNNQTQLFPEHSLRTANTTKGIYAGVCISVLVLLALLGAIIAKMFHLAAFKLKLCKMQLKRKSKQKTISTLRIVFMPRTKTQWCSLRVYAHECRRLNRHQHIRRLLDPKTIFLFQFHLAFQHVSDTG
ncbi:HAVCR1 isoform 4 [Pan troglodytes]|uniref:HAVCR1 isoform 1 n=2 Tax=Pan troglodytes TaxID=9598 RepID=A0A6D2WH28_PANTR|nr:HAVCR1 isoform 1 [Pan troglodytes]PNI72171.1 HAVCR1 isoform 4 [Pan troglodytes]